MDLITFLTTKHYMEKAVGIYTEEKMLPSSSHVSIF